MQQLNQDIVLRISDYLNARDINQYHQINPYFEFVLCQKNHDNKRMVECWLGSLNIYHKMYPLQYFFENTPFEQFVFILKSGIFDRHLRSFDILYQASRSLDYPKFCILYDFFEKNNLPITNMFLSNTLKFRRPSKDREMIHQFLEEKQMSIKI